MGIEIERKFLIDIDSVLNLGVGEKIEQGYIETKNQNSGTVESLW